jgi:hypothetical protein
MHPAAGHAGPRPPGWRPGGPGCTDGGSGRAAGPAARALLRQCRPDSDCARGPEGLVVILHRASRPPPARARRWSLSLIPRRLFSTLVLASYCPAQPSGDGVAAVVAKQGLLARGRTRGPWRGPPASRMFGPAAPLRAPVGRSRHGAWSCLSGLAQGFPRRTVQHGCRQTVLLGLAHQVSRLSPSCRGPLAWLWLP